MSRPRHQSRCLSSAVAVYEIGSTLNACPRASRGEALALCGGPGVAMAFRSLNASE
jgi:hypothetical protein